MYKGVAIILSLVLLSGAGYYWWHVSSQPLPPGPVTATISYTEHGYEPSEVTIKKGEAVRWVNDSQRDMWPAAAVHPTHSLYPEKSDADCLGSSFDACVNLPPSADWEFTFHETGDWRFHDHLTPSKTGVVHVIE